MICDLREIIVPYNLTVANSKVKEVNDGDIVRDERVRMKDVPMNMGLGHETTSWDIEDILREGRG